MEKFSYSQTRRESKSSMNRQVCAHSESANYQISTVWFTFKVRNLFLPITNTNTYLYTNGFIYVMGYIINVRACCYFSDNMCFGTLDWMQLLGYSWKQLDRNGQSMGYRSYFSFFLWVQLILSLWYINLNFFFFSIYVNL